MVMGKNMSEDFMEISREDIENIENALKVNADYKLKNTKFNAKSFENSSASCGQVVTHS